MQRVGHLFSTFCSFHNLLSAWHKTRRGSGASADAGRFFEELEKELLLLCEELGNGIWQPKPFRYFDIFDPKHRSIAVADFRDRVVHHALVNVLEPIYEKSFISDSFATRKGKGVHAAVARAQHFLRQHDFFLKTDIEKFFDSVPHQVLLNLISRKIKDPALIKICEKIIKHGGERGYGLPIGNRTSQFFANVFLDPLDHFLKERRQVSGYVRYMDDFVLFENDKKSLQKIHLDVADFLSYNLGLQLKAKSTFLNRSQYGLPFLGRQIFRGYIRIRSENLRRMTRRIALRERQVFAGDISEAEFLHSMNSYWAMLSYYKSWQALRNDLIY